MNSKTRHLTVSVSLFNVQIPSFQRPLNNDHVQLIYNETNRWLSRNYSPPFQSITIGEYPEIMENSHTSIYNYIILDGQHRYEAYKRHTLEGKNFTFEIDVINCANIEEANYFYQIFNRRMEHSNIELTNNLSITNLDKEIQRYISNDSIHFTTASNGARPRIRVNDIFDKYMKSNIRSSIKSLDDFRNYLNLKNNEEYVKFSQLGFSRLTGTGVTQSIIDKAVKINWWLGLDFNYTWLE